MKKKNKTIISLKGYVKKKATKSIGEKSRGFGSNFKNKFFSFLTKGQILAFFDIGKVRFWYLFEVN